MKVIKKGILTVFLVFSMMIVTVSASCVEVSSATLQGSVVSLAKSLNGKPYVFGAQGPNAFDCAGFVYYVYHKYGLISKYQTAETYWANPTKFGKVVSESNAQPGDIISWSDHVGIYLGDGKVIHAMNPSLGVRITTVSCVINTQGVRNAPHRYIRVYGMNCGTPSLKNASAGISLNWGKVTNMSGYKIYRSEAGGEYSTVKTITSNGTLSYNDETASKNGKKYSYKLRAYKSISGTKYYSSYSSVKTTYKVSKPKITELVAGTKKFTVKWTENTSATGYRIYYSTSSSFASSKYTTITSKSTTSKTIGSLSANKKYYVRMKTYKTVNSVKYWSVYSSSKYVTTKA